MKSVFLIIIMFSFPLFSQTDNTTSNWTGVESYTISWIDGQPVKEPFNKNCCCCQCKPTYGDWYKYKAISIPAITDLLGLIELERREKIDLHKLYSLKSTVK